MDIQGFRENTTSDSRNLLPYYVMIRNKKKSEARLWACTVFPCLCKVSSSNLKIIHDWMRGNGKNHKEALLFQILPAKTSSIHMGPHGRLAMHSKHYRTRLLGFCPLTVQYEGIHELLWAPKVWLPSTCSTSPCFLNLAYCWGEAQMPCWILASLGLKGQRQWYHQEECSSHLLHCYYFRHPAHISCSPQPRVGNLLHHRPDLPCKGTGSGLHITKGGPIP